MEYLRGGRTIRKLMNHHDDEHGRTDATPSTVNAPREQQIAHRGSQPFFPEPLPGNSEEIRSSHPAIHRPIHLVPFYISLPSLPG